MKRELFEVEVKMTLYVLAESDKQAEDIAKDYFHDEEPNAWAIAVSHHRRFPKEVSESLPYVAEGTEDEEELTVGEIVNRMREEKEAEHAQQRAAAAQAKLPLEEPPK